MGSGPKKNIASLLDDLNTPVAVYSEDRRVTSDELRRLVGQLAEALADVNLERGQVVAVSLPNRPCVIAAMFAVWHRGAVYAPLNPRSGEADLSTVLEQLRPALVITAPSNIERFEAWPVMEFDDAGVGQKAVGARTDAVCHDPDVALIQFTSGTTGTPKPVQLRHGNVLDLIDRVVATIRRGRSASGSSEASVRSTGMPNLIPVSLSLWAGIYQVLFAFRVGSPVVIMERFEPAEFARLVRTFGIRSSVLPPAAMTMLCNAREVDDLTPLRTVRSITAPLAAAHARRFAERFGVTVLNGYGQTELGGEVVGWTAADAREYGSDKLGSVGRPNAGIEVAVLAGDAVCHAPDEVGEILVRTPATREGKLDVSFAERLLPDGWFRTGDLGSVDVDGFVWVSGRVSDMINRGGLKVYPGQVEDVLLSMVEVGDVAVVGVPDDRLGEVPWAWVVPAAGHIMVPAVLAAECRRRLTPYKVPVRFIQMDELPRNEVGKVLKKDLLSRDWETAAPQ